MTYNYIYSRDVTIFFTSNKYLEENILKQIALDSWSQTGYTPQSLEGNATVWLIQPPADSDCSCSTAEGHL